MGTDPQRTRSGATNTAQTVRIRIESSGERLWRLADFGSLPLTAVAQTLSPLSPGCHRASGQGPVLPTAAHGVRPEPAQSGPAEVADHTAKGVFPAGTAATNLLGFTTQNPARIELATDSPSLPRRFLGKNALVHTRRPPAWRNLPETDAALLDFLRNRGTSNELLPKQAVDKLLAYFREPGRFERLIKAGASGHPASGPCSVPSASRSVGPTRLRPAATQLESALPV